MKKLSLCLVLIGFALLGGLFAQNREVWIEEDFSSGTFPPAGWTISNNAGNWSLFAGANAGGTTPELRLSWSPQFNAASYFISPSLDTSGETTMYLDFRHFVDHYSTPYTIGVATRSNQGAWNVAWSMNPTANVGPELRTVAIDNTDVGSTDFQFAIFFSGSSYNIDYWYIDNIKFYTPFFNDLGITAANLPAQVDAGTSINPSCTVKNLGLNPLTATVSLNIYRGDELLHSQIDYFSAYLQSFETATANFTAFIPALANELYRFEFGVTSIEDVVDDDPGNNALTAFVNTWTTPRQMVVLEIGTGGWCPYCPGAAMAADDFIDDGYNVAVIENHNGDPYANDTSNNRNDYYGISGYPTGFFDGVLSHVGGSNSSSIIGSYLPLYNQRNAIKTPLNLHIYGEETRENYEITIRVEKLAPLPYENLVAHLAITESDIAYNWQGQNHFNFVNRMMYPDWNGTTVDLVNAPLGFTDVELSIVKDPSWVATSCELVAFIQNLDTKEIIQGQKIMIFNLTAPPVANDDPGLPALQTSLAGIAPNPFSEKTSISYSVKESAPVSLGVYNLKGQLVKTLVAETKAAGTYQLSWDGLDASGNQVANGAYILRLSSGQDVSTRKLMLIK
ncbi:MAG: T9SS type A sorting domain-containing protein [Candidatus Cloacimonetes bacterium]|nr:T9SS type A sorting domain-containing protein [Candidatus Cloacimonadota bacterium]MDY0366239.1 FlgD immunoglobulin-like domain containing protein [Candidatus Syntrophosphaera sp.]